MTTFSWREWAQRAWLSVRKETPPPLTAPDTYSDAEIAAMLRSLGMALLEVGQPTNLVISRLLTIAARYTCKKVRVAVLPTMLMIQIETTGCTEIQMSTRVTARLDQAGRIDDIVDLAAVGSITPADAMAAVVEARKLPPRFGSLLSIVGHAVATIGFGMVINPTWAALPGYALLGAVVGAVLVISRPVPALAPILPTLSAFLITVLATLFVADAANDGLLRVITPALVAILPGMALTTGAMELASGQVVAGSTRLVYGVAQLMLLAFGVVLGIHVAGRVAPQEASAPMGEWALYAAVVVMAIGFYLFLSAPPGSLIWLVLAIGVALIGQHLGGLFLDRSLAGSIGAFAVVPVAMFASRFKSAPPGVVMILAAFWGLVPGALSFVRFSQAATGGPADLAALAETVAALFAIALGTLVGWAVFRSFTSGVHRGSDPGGAG